VVGFTIGSRGKVPGKTCEKRRNNNNFNSIQFNSILYFNVLTQQLQEPITESAQEDKYIHSKEINIKMRTKLN
jgi:hypothetical protein